MGARHGSSGTQVIYSNRNGFCWCNFFAVPECNFLSLMRPFFYFAIFWLAKGAVCYVMPDVENVRRVWFLIVCGLE